MRTRRKKKRMHPRIYIGITLFIIAILILVVIIQFSDNSFTSSNLITHDHVSVNEFVTVTLQGGLGNQMFQIATAMSYAKTNNKKFIMNTNIFELVGLSIRKTYWDIFDPQHDDKLDTYNWQEIKESSFAFKQLDPIEGNVKLTGYFQSANYFDTVRDEIISRFVNVPHTISKDTISIHIRRTDYIGLNFYVELKQQYYQSSIEYIQSFSLHPLKLIVFSDDLEWVKKSGWFDSNVTFYDQPGDYEQLIAMSQCEHHIMANSSYSWWSVYLGNQDGITIAPKHWFVDVTINTNDLYLPNWIKM